jgi:Tol biopolymer transport system component
MSLAGRLVRLEVTLAAKVAALLLAAGLGVAQENSPSGYELALVSLEGRRETLGRVPGTVYAPRLSHDGTRVTFDDQRREGPTIYVAELDDLGARQPLPRHGAYNLFPLWSADDRYVLFIAPDGEEQALFRQRADGSGGVELLAKPARAPEAWAPDGRALTFITLTGDDYAISTWDPASRTATRLLQREGSLQHSSRYSNDGRWLAYASNETGRFEVWVEPIPMTGERHRITTDGGEHPLWAPDGETIYFDSGGRMYAVAVDPSADFRRSPPRALPIEGFRQQPGARRQFDITPDGERFLMLYPLF